MYLTMKIHCNILINTHATVKSLYARYCNYFLKMQSSKGKLEEIPGIAIQYKKDQSFFSWDWKRVWYISQEKDTRIFQQALHLTKGNWCDLLLQ